MDLFKRKGTDLVSETSEQTPEQPTMIGMLPVGSDLLFMRHARLGYNSIEIVRARELPNILPSVEAMGLFIIGLAAGPSRIDIFHTRTSRTYYTAREVLGQLQKNKDVPEARLYTAWQEGSAENPNFNNSQIQNIGKSAIDQSSVTLVVGHDFTIRDLTDQEVYTDNYAQVMHIAGGEINTVHRGYK